MSDQRGRIADTGIVYASTGAHYVCGFTGAYAYFGPTGAFQQYAGPTRPAVVRCEYCARTQERPADGGCVSCGAPLK